MTVNFIHKNNHEIIDIINDFMQGNNVQLSNYYGLNEAYRYAIFCDEDIVLISQLNGKFSRLYFVTNNEESLINALNSLPSGTFVFNIPVRNELGKYESLVAHCDFEKCAHYHRYYNKDIQGGYNTISGFANEEELLSGEGYKISEPAKVTDAQEVYNLLMSTFDVYTDYIPTLNQLEGMIADQNVFVNRLPNGEICGVAVFVCTGRKCYQNFWIDKSELGLYLMKKMYEQMLEKGITYTNMWIADWNKSVIRLHKTLGAVPDGMIDYTYKKISK